MIDGHDFTGCRVLIVEDDALLSMVLVDLLTAMGCAVAASASRYGDAARKCETVAFDVAMIDINLRGERTFPIAETLLARQQAFVLVTGYGAKVLPDSLREVPLLQKPYRRRDLEAALWEAMHRG